MQETGESLQWFVANVMCLIPKRSMLLGIQSCRVLRDARYKMLGGGVLRVCNIVFIQCIGSCYAGKQQVGKQCADSC